MVTSWRQCVPSAHRQVVPSGQVQEQPSQCQKRNDLHGLSDRTLYGQRRQHFDRVQIVPREQLLPGPRGKSAHTSPRGVWARRKKNRSRHQHNRHFLRQVRTWILCCRRIPSQSNRVYRLQRWKVCPWTWAHGMLSVDRRVCPWVPAAGIWQSFI